MPRASRYIVPGAIYHVTHRCHDRSFLFRFAKDRSVYREMLRDRLDRYSIEVLGYCITSNHTHLLVRVREGAVEALAGFMQSLEGDFAQYYNLRKERSGAFWSDRYHAVMVDDGEYFWRCLRYIDLNMVRAGAVRDPADWEWCGYREFIGLRQRYRVIDRAACAEAAAPGLALEDVVERYRDTVNRALAERTLARDALWTESLAVGSEPFVRRMADRIRNRMEVEVEQTPTGSWRLLEAGVPYGCFFVQKNASKRAKPACSVS